MANRTLQTSDMPKAVPLHSRAEDNLQFIRDAMEGASSFTSISGIGLVGVGLIGLITCLVQASISETLSIPLWLGALALSFTFSTAMTMNKAKDQGTSLWSAGGKKLLYAFAPAMFVGGIVTLYFLVNPIDAPLPAFWLALYGSAIMTAGAYSIALIRIMGAVFILLGGITFFSPVPENLMMGLGFGGFHFITGIVIWKFHGG